MWSRRRFVSLAATACAGMAVVGPVASARAGQEEPYLNDSGLYEQPWFLQSFLDLAEDLEMAASEGKRFAIMWELQGCPYCKETHLVNFADPEINAFVRENFVIVQLNLIGAREVVDFDGEALEERALARKWGVRFTPTTIFLPESLDAVAGRPGHEAEVARMPGYFRPPHFLAMYRYVDEKAYESVGFRDYLKTRLQG